MQTISDIIEVLCKSNEEMTILKYENILIGMFYPPILLLGSILNFFYFYFILHQDIKSNLINSLILFAFFLAFELFFRIIEDEKLKSYVFTFLFSAVLVIVVIRFYYLIGPTIWMISVFIVMIAMGRLKRSMLITISVTNLLLGMYVWYKSYPFIMQTTYYVAQFVSFTIFFIIAEAVHKTIIKRYEKIKDSENEYHNLFESARDAILVVDIEKSTIINVNQNTIQLLGYTYEELIRKSILELYLSEKEESFLEYSQKPSKKVSNDLIEIDVIHKDGRHIPVEISIGTPIILRGRAAAVCFLRDITQRKQTEDLLKIERERLSNIIEGTNAGTWEWNVQTGETVFNQRLETGFLISFLSIP